MNQGKYKRKIYVTFLVVFSVLIVIFTGVFFTTVLERSATERETAIIQSLKTAVSNSQLKYEILDNAMESLAVSDEIDVWQRSDSWNVFYYNSIRLQEYIRKATARVNNVAYELSVTSFTEDTFVITPYSTEDKDSYFRDNLQLGEAQVAAVYDHFADSTNYLAFTVERNEGIPEICIINKRIYSEQEILFIVLIDQKQFLDLQEGSEWYLCSNKGIFAKSGDLDTKGLYDEFSSNSWDSQFTYGDRTIYPQTYSNIGWSVLFAYDVNVYETSSFILFFIIPLLGLAATAAVAANLITRRLYKPMEEVIEDMYQGDAPRQVDEFQMIRQNSEMIKGLNTKLRTALNERNTLLRQRFARELVFGIQLSRDRYPEEWFREVAYAVAVIEFTPETYKIQDENLLLYKNEIISYTQLTPDMMYVSLNYYTYAVIIETDDQKEARTKINNLIDHMAAEDEVDIRIALSEVRHGLEPIRESFTESRKILEYKYLFHQGTILTMGQLASLDQESYYFPLRTENKLIHSVLAGDIKALDIYDHLVFASDVNNSLSPEAFKNFVFALIGTISRVVQELKVDSGQFLGEGMDFAGLSDHWSDEEIAGELRDIFERMIQYVADNKENSEDILAKEMLAYIHNNYTDDIMLVDLADKLNVSEKYCGILFKKAVGENYKTYLNSYRIEQAKEIIYKDPDVKVSDLGKWVGFNSSNTFIRVFTKHTGMTPKKYAEEYVISRKQKR